MEDVALRLFVIAMFCLPLLSCSCARVSAVSAAEAPAVASSGDGGATAAVAVIGAGHDEAEEAIGASVASDLVAVHVGVVSDLAAARVAAGASGAGTLIACKVLAYSPYDPSRVSISYTVTDAGHGKPSWEDVMRSSRRASARDDVGSGVRRRSLTGAVEVDAGDERTLNEYASARLGERWGGPHDLLEAEILLRDPARFLQFAAGRVVEEVRATVLP